MEPVVLARSSRKWILLLVVAFLFVAAGTLIVATADTTRDRAVGWLNIVFFGACAISFVSQLRDRRARITMDDRGIEDRTLKVGVIEWADIEGVELREQHGATFIGLDLRDPEKYTGRLSPMLRRMVALNERLGYATLNINLTGMAADPAQVVALIAAEVEARRMGGGVAHRAGARTAARQKEPS